MFIHLNVKSEYSIQDSTLRMSQIVERAAKFGMTHVALTDHGNMYGAFAFERACKAKGITPIFGVDLQVDGYSLVVLAETQEGYANLVRAVTHANSVGKKKDNPHITKDVLSQYATGLIALSGGISGEISSLLLEQKKEDARKVCDFYSSIFGKDNFFLEITDHGLPEEQRLKELLQELSKQTGIELVVTNEVHYAAPEHAYARSVFSQLQDGKEKWDLHTEFSDQYHFASPEEMKNRFVGYEQAIENTVRIAKRCSGVSIPVERALPDFPIPAGETTDSYFEKIAFEGLHARYPNATQEYVDRLTYEVKTIQEMGFSAYFLIVWDFIRYAKENNIPVGPGRGSAAGSLVADVLQITDLDPIKNHLLFERFLNPERISMPDIDIDFDYERRHEMLEYVQNKYGTDHVSQIITFGTMGTKMVIRDIGRILGLSFKETDELSKEVEIRHTLANLKEIPFFQDRIESDERIAELFKIGEIIEGLVRHTSVHAAGVVISRLPLQTYVPLKEENGVMITQWDMGQIEKIGLLKMDFLGLKTLTIIKHTLNYIKESRGITLTEADIPWEDKKTLEMLSKGDSGAVFQLEGGGMKRSLRDLKPNSFEDVVALLALYRPGPMKHIPDYIKNKEKGDFYVPHPAMRPILAVTHGIIVYQEQIQKVAQVLAGYSLGEADVLRRAVGKKEAEVLDAERANFVPRCVANGVDEKIANEVYDLIVEFANYGFNRSHAAAYGVISVKTGYLRCHYPAEFMAANLTVAIGDSEKLRIALAECKRMGIEVLPPKLGTSKDIFTVEGDKIRYGLLAIRNVGERLAQELANAPAYDSLETYLKEIPASLYTKAMWENLIRAGALDHLGNRGTHLHHLENLIHFAREQYELKQGGQLSFFDLGLISNAELSIVPDPPALELLRQERNVLEIMLSGHPLDSCMDIVSAVTPYTLLDLDETFNGQKITVAGVATNIKTIITKKGQKMAFATIQDIGEEIEVIVFPKAYETVQLLLKPNIPLFFTGRVEWDDKEQKSKLILDSIKTILSGRQVVYIRVNNEKEAATLRRKLADHNGITEVLFFDAKTKKIVPQKFRIRMNQETLKVLENVTYTSM